MSTEVIPFTHPNDYPVLPKQYRILQRGGRTVAAVMMPYPTLDSGANCVGDEDFTADLANAPQEQIDRMKAACNACPLRVACAEWGIAHERAYMYGALLPGERAAIRRQRGQVVVEPSAAHHYDMGDEYIQNRGGGCGWDKAAAPVDEGYAADLPWTPSGARLMARVRPTEHKAIVAMLTAPAESVEDLATDVIQKIDELRLDRHDYYVIIHDPGVCVHLHGPYVTKNAAVKAATKGELYAASAGATYLVLPIHDSIDEGV